MDGIGWNPRTVLDSRHPKKLGPQPDTLRAEGEHKHELALP
jgi:hypothetical protein